MRDLNGEHYFGEAGPLVVAHWDRLKLKWSLKYNQKSSDGGGGGPQVVLLPKNNVPHNIT